MQRSSSLKRFLASFVTSVAIFVQLAHAQDINGPKSTENDGSEIVDLGNFVSMISDSTILGASEEYDNAKNSSIANMHLGCSALGDVNKDGKVDVSDLVRVIGIILSLGEEPTAEEILAADINGDGEINVSDLIRIINLILGIGLNSKTYQPEFISEFRFFHAAFDLGHVGVYVDGKCIESISFKGNIPHQQFLAGVRMVTAGDVTQPVPMATDERGTVVILPNRGSGRYLIKLFERKIFDNPVTTEAFYRVVHAADAPSIETTITEANPRDPDNPIEITVSSRFAPVTIGYFDIDPLMNGIQGIPAGEYRISIASEDDGTVLLQDSVSLSNRRQTSIVVGSADDGTLEIVTLND